MFTGTIHTGQVKYYHGYPNKDDCLHSNKQGVDHSAELHLAQNLLNSAQSCFGVG